jgi:hypothetical protein
MKEHAWPSVENERVSSSYDQNSLSGLIFCKTKHIAYFQPVSPDLTDVKNLIYLNPYK